MGSVQSTEKWTQILTHLVIGTLEAPIHNPTFKEMSSLKASYAFDFETFSQEGAK